MIIEQHGVVICNENFRKKEARGLVIKQIENKFNCVRINSYKFKIWECDKCHLFLDIVIGGRDELEINKFITQLQIDYSAH